MSTRRSRDRLGRFASYLDGLAGVMGHAARVGPMRDDCRHRTCFAAMSVLCDATHQRQKTVKYLTQYD